jgi:hypothetical protein
MRRLCSVLTACVALVAASPAAAASGNLFEDIACPSAQLCVAVDDVGNVVTSTDPSGGAGAWKAVTIDAPHRLISVACASPQLCVTADDNGDVLTSHDPAGGARAWRRTHAGLHGDSDPKVVCPSAQLCMAVDQLGEAYAPATSGARWQRARVGPSGLDDVACPSAQLCVAVGLDGLAVTSVAPGASRSAWRSAPIDPPNELRTVSCPSPALCVAGDEDGGMLVSTSPTGGTAAWTRLQLVPAGRFDPIGDVACPSPALCIGLGTDTTWFSTNPTGGAGAWVSTTSIGFDELACPSAQLCVATDLFGHRWASTDPANPAAHWSRALVDVLRPSAFSFETVTALAHGAVKLQLRVPYTGVLTARDASAGAALIRPLRIVATGTGDDTITLRPTALARRLLARRGRLAVRVRVTYVPGGGRAVSHTLKVTLGSKRSGSWKLS